MDAVLVSSKYIYRSTIINPLMMNIYSPIVKYSNSNNSNTVEPEGLKVVKTYPLHSKKEIGRMCRSMSWSN